MRKMITKIFWAARADVRKLKNHEDSACAPKWESWARHENESKRQKKERLEFKLITKLHADDAGTHTICPKFAVALHARLGRDF